MPTCLSQLMLTGRRFYRPLTTAHRPLFPPPTVYCPARLRYYLALNLTDLVPEAPAGSSRVTGVFSADESEYSWQTLNRSPTDIIPLPVT